MTLTDACLITIAFVLAWLNGKWVERQYPRDTPWSVYFLSELDNIIRTIFRLTVGLCLRIVRAVIEEYGSYKPSHGDIRTEVILDPVNDHYELMHAGWDGTRRVHGCVIHLDIIDGKIWIQYDGTSEPVADELERAGVPKSDIVLGFLPENVRIHSGYAVA